MTTLFLSPLGISAIPCDCHVSCKRGAMFSHQFVSRENRVLLALISKLETDSTHNLNRANAEAADEQLREIKKFRKGQPKSLMRKGIYY